MYKRQVRSYAERHNIPKWYTDAQQLIDDPDVNAVYIATPPSTHVTYAIMTLKSGKPAYIEKPLASNYQDCGRINRIAEKTGVPCFEMCIRDSNYTISFHHVFFLIHTALFAFLLSWLTIHQRIIFSSRNAFSNKAFAC